MKAEVSQDLAVPPDGGYRAGRSQGEEEITSSSETRERNCFKPVRVCVFWKIFLVASENANVLSNTCAHLHNKRKNKTPLRKGTASPWVLGATQRYRGGWWKKSREIPPQEAVHMSPSILLLQSRIYFHPAAPRWF